jgi:anti-sigma regulatory factor (Ser/Thr protein kinase)
MRQQFTKDMQSLDDVFGFLTRFTAAESVDLRAAYAITLAVEEFFTNMVKYSRGSNGGVLIEATREGDRVTVRLEEQTPAPFDVTRPTATQFDIPVPDRRPGGLGIHIAKELLDDLRYDYADGTSRITLIKQLEK